MSSVDVILHTCGKSRFVDDLTCPDGLLYAYVFTSPVAKGKIINIDLSSAEKIVGVRAILTSKDITGENQIGGVIPDEPLLADGEVNFIGQPIAIIVADDESIARKAAKKITVDIEELQPIFDAREACSKGELIIPPQTFVLGNIDEAWKDCAYIIEDKVESGSQEHLYLETQSALSYPIEGGIKIHSSTQSPTHVQKTTARVLALPMNKIEVDVQRIGGGFGGKEDQATAWAVMTALASFKLQKPVKLILRRQDDMRWTGKRHPYSSDFKIGLNEEGKILAYEVTFYQNAGASADLSVPILMRTLFHCTNSYYIPNVKATAYCCRTNLPPFTAFRGFGGPQGMFVIESAIFKAAERMGVEPHQIQKKNLLKEGDDFPYGQKIKKSNVIECWSKSEQKYDFENIFKRVNDFNSKNVIMKKGAAVMPVCFGISFTNTFMNQASALVHIFIDGSVSVSTAAVEMGQGVNQKIRLVASKTLGISPERINIETTNTSRIANTSPTAASSGTDLNGKATEIACKNLIERLKNTASEILKTDLGKIQIKDEFLFVDGIKTDLTWQSLVAQAYIRRVSLSSHAFYATPKIWFDKEKMKGEPFAYHTVGTSITEVTVDCLRGTYQIDAVKVVHDFGNSFATQVDRGQAEGGIVQGIGWMTLEEVIYDIKGKLITDTLSTYKIPDIYFTPKEIEIHFLENSVNELAVLNSKAVGEPPFMYGIGAYFAIMNAIKSFRPGKQFKIVSPMTNERVLMSLYSD